MYNFAGFVRNSAKDAEKPGARRIPRVSSIYICNSVTFDRKYTDETERKSDNERESESERIWKGQKPLGISRRDTRTVHTVGVYTGEPRTRACSPSGYAPALNADPKENEG
ncbi:hypothetical protein ALC53_06393 [Atta colombica]|uniref:Uncharacterized protein n=1 Tax=Atta colombica TaxID=520822 RepID=A0A195BEV9_9HYME|nr:hypothetical protein ALC53_06393 [Atta colombica]